MKDYYESDDIVGVIESSISRISEDNCKSFYNHVEKIIRNPLYL